MKFQYKKLGANTSRPVIPVELFAERDGLSIRYEVLVDSGADCNMMPAEIGELLGIDIEKGKKNEVGGITGGGMPYYTHSVFLRIGGHTNKVEVGFMPNMPSFGYGVVGQRGFFDLFKVTFDRRKGEIDVRSY